MTSLACHSCKKVFQIEGEGTFACPHCGAQNQFGDSGARSNAYSSWEQTYRDQTFHAFVETIKSVLFSPVVFFNRLKVSQKFFPVVIFGVAAQFLGYLATFLYQITFSVMKPALLAFVFKNLKLEDLLEGLFTPLFVGGVLLLMPLISLVGIIFSTALNHFILWVLKGTTKGIEGTLHVVCYSMASQVFLIVPLFGGIVAAVWQIILVIIGLKEVHGAPYWKTVLTVFLPMILCCLAIVGIGLVAAIMIPAFLHQRGGF